MARKSFGEIEFGKVYPMYLRKVEAKGRSRAELDEVIVWFTGYNLAEVARWAEGSEDFQTFFAAAPAMHPNRDRITGTICGYRVEEIKDPLEQKVRQLDKLVDELAKGKPMEKILRS